jgi:hypothetical protein
MVIERGQHVIVDSVGGFAARVDFNTFMQVRGGGSSKVLFVWRAEKP